MTASTVYLNGEKLGEYRGGYTPFSFELTQHLKPGAPNLLSVEVDSTERADIPPFGNEIDYLTFGGIYREVALRVVPQVFLENIYARPQNVLSPKAALSPSKCFLDRALDRAADTHPRHLSLHAELRKEGSPTPLSTASLAIADPPVSQHHPADADQAQGALPPVTPVPGSLHRSHSKS